MSFSKERARPHNSDMFQFCSWLTALGYDAEPLPALGFRPDVLVGDRAGNEAYLEHKHPERENIAVPVGELLYAQDSDDLVLFVTNNLEIDTFETLSERVIPKDGHPVRQGPHNSYVVFKHGGYNPLEVFPDGGYMRFPWATT